MSLATTSYRRRHFPSQVSTNFDDHSSLTLKEKNKDLRRQILAKSELLEQKEKEVEELVVSLNKIRREKVKIQCELEVKEREVDDSERNNARIKQRLSQLEKEKKENQYEIESLQASVRRLEGMDSPNLQGYNVY